MGVRYLDLRFGLKKGVFVDAHRFVKGTFFIETILEIRNFLEKHTGEFIIINLQNEWGIKQD
jgi:hypothetical protein